MGFSLSWYAVKGKAPERVLAELGLRPAGAVAGPDESPRDSAATLPAGWYLVSRNGHQYHDATLERLSQGAEVVAYFTEEHVMVSKAAAWTDGKEVWTIVHDSAQGVEHLEARGQLPPEFAAICNRRLTEQKAETEDCDHVIEVPYETAAVVTGYEHDSVREDLQFEVLNKVSLIRRLFQR